MSKPELVSLEIDGAELAVRLAGDRAKPTLVLIHGFPSSSKSFREVIGPLARDCFVIAPDLPGFGASEPISRPSFSRFADVLDGLLTRLQVGSLYLYLHDFGAAVGLHIATRAPQRIRGLIVQNPNAHESGMGPQWSATRAYWEDPTPEREAEATAHLTFEGTRDQYVGGVPQDIAERIDSRLWEEDWRIMSLPGRLATQRALVLDYRSHAARFGEIAEYLDRWQPPALMLWGRHDSFFDLEETLSWMKALPRMEAHILDGAHFLLETHSTECAGLMSAFVRRVEGLRPTPIQVGGSQTSRRALGYRWLVDLAEQYRRQRAWRRWEEAYRHLGDLEGQLVFDLGCGIGDQAADLAARGAKVVGIDVDEALLGRARERQIAAARFLRMDLRSPVELAGERADGLWMGFSAAYFPDMGTALDGWTRWLRAPSWIAITEVDDLLAHEPLEPRWRRAIEAFYAAARARGAYAFRSHEPIREALAARGWHIAVDEALPDAELSFYGPATPDVFEAWRLRLDRMHGFATFLGGDAAAFRQAFLDCLRDAEHRSLSRVWFLLARRAAA